MLTLKKIITFLQKRIKKNFLSIFFECLLISFLYLISITTYAKLLQIFAPRSSRKIFKIFLFLNYLRKNRILSYFINKRTIYFSAFFLKFFSRRRYIRLPKLVQYNLNYLLILETIAALFFSWWYFLFGQKNSNLKVERRIRYSKSTRFDFVPLTIITFFYILIFAYSYIVSLLGIFVYIPIISESAMMWTEAELRYKKSRNRYSKENFEKLFL